MAVGWAHPTTGHNEHHKTGTRLEPQQEAQTRPSNHDLEKNSWHRTSHIWNLLGRGQAQSTGP